GVLFLVGDDPDRPAADARVATDDRLSALGAVFLEFAAVHDSRDHFAHVVLLGAVGGSDSVDFLGGIGGRLGGLVVKRSARRVAELIDEGANTPDAGVVVRLAEIDGAASLRMHPCAAELFGRR